MASPAVLQRDFLRMARDFARNQLPQGAVWNMVDWIPRRDAPLRGRGGWLTYADVNAINGAVNIRAGIYAPFLAVAPQNLAIDNGGALVKITNGTVSPVGSVGVPLQNPVFHDGYVIIPSPNGTTAPNRYNGTSIAALGGAPPAGRYATVWNDYTVLANTVANPNRVFFSEATDPNIWSASTDLVDFSRAVKGLATLRQTILVFHDDAISRLRGTTPPAGDDADLVSDDPAFLVGTVDARSISTHADWCYFCSTEGVFRTDGVSVEDLTRRGDMASYWSDLMQGYNAATWTFVSGVVNNTLFVIVDVAGGANDGFMCNLRDFSWSRISNVDACSMWPSVTVFDELYFGRSQQGKVGRVSPIFTPAGSNQNDGDGTAVLPVLETAFYEGEPGEKSWKKCYVGYELHDYASDDPMLWVTLVTTPAGTAYSSVYGTLRERDGYKRDRFDLHFSSEGVGFRLAQIGKGDARLYGIEAEVHPRERSRLAQ